MILKKFSSLTNYLKVFSSPNEAIKFRKIKQNKTDKVISLKVKEANNPILCRPNTTDAQVLWDTFYRKYHLPPITLSDNSIIVDLGANVGYTMVHFVYLYPMSKIYGVEIDEGNFFIAKKNLQPLKKRAQILRVAVWHENDKVVYGGEQEWGFRILDENDKAKIKYEVEAKTVDSIFDEFNLTIVDYLKMDVEGAEGKILQNPEKWITKVKSIKIEYHYQNTYESCSNLLQKHGFECKKDSNHPACIIGINRNFI